MDTAVKPLTIHMSFAHDDNGNHQIEPEEIVKNLAELDKYDKKGDGKLAGDDFDGIYYEIGKDKWAPGGRPYYDKVDGAEFCYNLKEVDLKSGAIKMHVNILC